MRKQRKKRKGEDGKGHYGILGREGDGIERLK